jgi:hypothetical protein
MPGTDSPPKAKIATSSTRTARPAALGLTPAVALAPVAPVAAPASLALAAPDIRVRLI